MEFFEARAFSRYLSDYLKSDEYRSLQSLLCENPELGEIMPGTGGFRKLRWTDARRGKGRRGGLRIIYYFFNAAQQIWLLTIYDKDEAIDLSPAQKKKLKAALESELEARNDARKKIRRSRRL